MMEHQQPKSASPYRSTPSPYLYDVDPSLHASQKPSEVPRVKRNLVQNLVDKFNEEAKRRELCRHHSVDDSLMRNYDVVDHHHNHHQHHHRTTSPAGVIEANSDNAPNHNHPFSYVNKKNIINNNKNNINNNNNHNNNDKMMTMTSRAPTNGLASQRQYRSDYNIGPSIRHQPTHQPTEIIYAHVVKSTDENNKSGKRVKTTVHTKVPNRMVGGSSVADSKSKSFTKSTGSLNMSAHRVQDHDPDEADDKLKNHQRNGNYYRYAEVDENIRQSGSGHGRRKPNNIVDTVGLSSPSRIESLAGPGPGPVPAYETRNVERWSENEVKPNSRKFTEHEYVHEVSVNKGPPKTPKEDYFASKSPTRGHIKDRNASTSSSTAKIVSEDETKAWHSLRRGGGGGTNREKWIDHHDGDYNNIRLTDSEFGRSKKGPADMRRYYFGEPDAAPEKPPRQRWITSGVGVGVGGHRLRRNSEESVASSGVGLLSSKLVKKANEKFSFGGTGAGEYTVDGFPLYTSLRRRRVSEGDSDVFPPAPATTQHNRNWWLSETNYDDLNGSGVNGIGNGNGSGLIEESRKVIRKREEKRTSEMTKRTTRHHSVGRSLDDEADGRIVNDLPQSRRRIVEPLAPAPATTNSTKRSTSNDVHQNGISKQLERQVIEERSSSATRRHHHHHQHNHHHHQTKNGSFDAEDRMETSESEQPLYGGSQESHMSLGSRLSSADEEQQHGTSVDNVHTPHSVVRQMNKRQINYENSQQHHQHQQQQQQQQQQKESTTGGRRFWFERATTDNVHADTDNRNNNRHNMNNNNNNRWTSATLSRLETTSNKNHRNGSALNDHDDRRWASNTVDRRRTNKLGNNEIHIRVNDRDVDDIGGGRSFKDVERSSSFNSRVGSYHSENESQGSSTTSTKSAGGTKTKRVNFKSKKSPANLSPVHREALLRSASPARAPSVASSHKSNDSEASHVILHATAVADIPPTRQYRLRSANTSPSPPASLISGSGGGKNRKESRTVNRSFSLLAPWKPRKYKEKYETSSKLSATNGSAPNLYHDDDDDDANRGKREEVIEKRRTTTSGGSSPQVRFKKTTTAYSDRNGDGSASAGVSRDSSSEKLDSLSPLPSESAKGSKKKSANGKKKSGLLRRHSMPKDSRFANFFRRKKDKESKK